MAKENKSAVAGKPATARAGAESDWDDSPMNRTPIAAPVLSTTTLPASPEAPGAATAETRPRLKLPDPIIERCEEGDNEPLPKEGDFKFPNDLKKSFKLLHEATALPSRTRRERKIREVSLAAIRKHVFALQQGVTPVTMGATEIAKAAPTHHTLRQYKLDMIARHIPEVKELLLEFYALKKENADLTELLLKA